jgi:hypothetical protein
MFDETNQAINICDHNIVNRLKKKNGKYNKINRPNKPKTTIFSLLLVFYSLYTGCFFLSNSFRKISFRFYQFFAYIFVDKATAMKLGILKRWILLMKTNPGLGENGDGNSNNLAG